MTRYLTLEWGTGPEPDPIGIPLADVALLSSLQAPTPTADPAVYGPSVVSLFVDVGTPAGLLTATQAALSPWASP